MITLENLVRKYGDFTAVDGISFEVRPDEVTGFLGPNGAGKTTTLRILAGYLPPTAGRVTITGLDAAENPTACKRIVGYLPENNPLYEDMEVFEFLEWSAKMQEIPASGVKAAVDAAVEKCSLSSVIGRNITQLSKGYRQRVGLAKAILHNPEVLLLDEPTSGLDPNQAEEVRNLLSGLKKEKTVLLSTHILSEVRAICDKVIIINNGRIAAQGGTEELTRSHSAKNRIILATAKKGGSALQEKISRLEGVDSVTKTSAGGEDIYAVASDPARDIRGPIYRLCVDGGEELLELRRETSSLEDVFKNLTA